MPLAGEPLVGRILERVKRCQAFDSIVLAIPDSGSDDDLARLASRYDVDVFRGSEADVRDRYLKAALQYKADLIVRLPADNATPDHRQIDRIVAHHLSLGRRGFSTNLAQIRGSGFPDGIGAEIFDTSLLVEAVERSDDPVLKEHTHRNFYDYSIDQAVDESWCPISTPNCPESIRRPDIVLDVNTIEQYKYISALYDALYNKNPNFTTEDIIDWHDREGHAFRA